MGKNIKFAIWHKDQSLTSTPEFAGTEGQVIAHWIRNYAHNTVSLNYKIAPSNPSRRCEFWDITGSSLENMTPPNG